MRAPSASNSPSALSARAGKLIIAGDRHRVVPDPPRRGLRRQEGPRADQAREVDNVDDVDNHDDVDYVVNQAREEVRDHVVHLPCQVF